MEGVERAVRALYHAAPGSREQQAANAWLLELEQADAGLDVGLELADRLVHRRNSGEGDVTGPEARVGPSAGDGTRQGSEEKNTNRKTSPDVLKIGGQSHGKHADDQDKVAFFASQLLLSKVRSQWSKVNPQQRERVYQLMSNLIEGGMHGDTSPLIQSRFRLILAAVCVRSVLQRPSLLKTAVEKFMKPPIRDGFEFLRLIVEELELCWFFLNDEEKQATHATIIDLRTLTLDLLDRAMVLYGENNLAEDVAKSAIQCLNSWTASVIISEIPSENKTRKENQIVNLGIGLRQILMRRASGHAIAEWIAHLINRCEPGSALFQHSITILVDTLSDQSYTSILSLREDELENYRWGVDLLAGALLTAFDTVVQWRSTQPPADSDDLEAGYEDLAVDPMRLKWRGVCMGAAALCAQHLRCLLFFCEASRVRVVHILLYGVENPVDLPTLEACLDFWDVAGDGFHGCYSFIAEWRRRHPGGTLVRKLPAILTRDGSLELFSMLVTGFVSCTAASLRAQDGSAAGLRLRHRIFDTLINLCMCWPELEQRQLPDAPGAAQSTGFGGGLGAQNNSSNSSNSSGGSGASSTGGTTVNGVQDYRQLGQTNTDNKNSSSSSSNNNSNNNNNSNGNGNGGLSGNGLWMSEGNGNRNGNGAVPSDQAPLGNGDGLRARNAGDSFVRHVLLLLHAKLRSEGMDNSLRLQAIVKCLIAVSEAEDSLEYDDDDDADDDSSDNENLEGDELLDEEDGTQNYAEGSDSLGGGSPNTFRSQNNDRSAQYMGKDWQGSGPDAAFRHQGDLTGSLSRPQSTSLSGQASPGTRQKPARTVSSESCGSTGRMSPVDEDLGESVNGSTRTMDSRGRTFSLSTNHTAQRRAAAASLASLWIDLLTDLMDWSWTTSDWSVRKAVCELLGEVTRIARTRASSPINGHGPGSALCQAIGYLLTSVAVVNGNTCLEASQALLNLGRKAAVKPWVLKELQSCQFVVSPVNANGQFRHDKQVKVLTGVEGLVLHFDEAEEVRNAFVLSPLTCAIVRESITNLAFRYVHLLRHTQETEARVQMLRGCLERQLGPSAQILRSARAAPDDADLDELSRAVSAALLTFKHVLRALDTADTGRRGRQLAVSATMPLFQVIWPDIAAVCSRLIRVARPQEQTDRVADPLNATVNLEFRQPGTGVPYGRQSAIRLITIFTGLYDQLASCFGASAAPFVPDMIDHMVSSFAVSSEPSCLKALAALPLMTGKIWNEADHNADAAALTRAVSFMVRELTQLLVRAAPSSPGPQRPQQTTATVLEVCIVAAVDVLDQGMQGMGFNVRQGQAVCNFITQAVKTASASSGEASALVAAYKPFLLAAALHFLAGQADQRYMVRTNLVVDLLRAVLQTKANGFDAGSTLTNILTSSAHSKLPAPTKQAVYDRLEKLPLDPAACKAAVSDVALLLSGHMQPSAAGPWPPETRAETAHGENQFVNVA
ncbi:Hypothetical Protein FCC1311_005815 [Hondaea fermentalgiana]|uniref:Uncharacterized protein n=1 Tax=Hondaea fermentalgiana TaxID=2315210 RepID=A0A2R5GTB7_9STRA|nr:Hypothetical Protein FCC1311_005815 [Hondaea fermentalgiana]|eukprot:GBG32998.1 Hypothetical Protein FCC1311_005815 [Hondaea fermentalgiana]